MIRWWVLCPVSWHGPSRLALPVQIPLLELGAVIGRRWRERGNGLLEPIPTEFRYLPTYPVRWSRPLPPDRYSPWGLSVSRWELESPH